jgi:hypothetical protein
MGNLTVMLSRGLAMLIRGGGELNFAIPGDNRRQRGERFAGLDAPQLDSFLWLSKSSMAATMESTA